MAYNTTGSHRLHPLANSWLLNTLLFACMLLFTWQVYLSGDDLNVMQILAGGYGNDPSACLPFFFNAHYFINVPLQRLYSHFPTINWYSIWLLAVQYLSGIAICYVLLRRMKFQTAAIAYLLFFLVFGSNMLLYLNHSFTSIVGALSAMLLVWHSLSGVPRPVYTLATGLGMLIIAALVRLHTLVPVIMISAPFFLLLPGNRNKLRAGFAIAATLLVCWLLYQHQYNYYAMRCPGWVQEEQYRQAKYANINFHKDQQAIEQSAYPLEATMANERLLFDTSFPSIATLDTLARTTNRPMTAGAFINKDTLYWSIVNNRLPLAALVLALLFCYSTIRAARMALLSVVVALASIIYMLLFRKMPAYFIIGALFTVTTFIVTTSPFTASKVRIKITAQALLLTALGAWALVRIGRASRHNEASFQTFQAQHKELTGMPDKLFINSTQNEIFSYFYCFADPSKYRSRNILFLDHPLSARSARLSADFGLDDIRKAPLLDHVFFFGPPSPTLQRYYQKVLGKPVHFSAPLPGYRQVEVHQLIVDE